MTWVRHHKHFILLLTSVLMLVLQPFAQGAVGSVFYDVVLALVLLGVFVLVFKRRSERVLALAIGGPALISRWATYGLTGDPLMIAAVIHHSLLLVFFTFAVTVILRGIFENETIGTDELLATVCGYLFAGAAWSSAYLVAETIAPHSFLVRPELAWELTASHTRHFLFTLFSLGTLTGHGYEGVLPVRPMVGNLAWMEAMFGHFYIAVVVAQLVGRMMSQAPEAPKSKSGY